MRQISHHRYYAFISYSHVDPDQKWALWIHSSIERYRIPEKLVKHKHLPRRLRPLFRDLEELPASQNLHEEIVKALKESDSLIVVCSTSTPDSKWVNEEILQFRELRPDGKILALLINGDPEQSFPASLFKICTDEKPRANGDNDDGGIDSKKRKNEVLAADVRPIEGISVSKRKNTAKLKLIAGILDCDYDELRQRERQRRRMNQAIYGTVFILTLIIFSMLAFRWFQERNDALSVELAANALEQLDKDPDLAALLSMNAINISPTAQAEHALREAALQLLNRITLLTGHNHIVRSAVYSTDGKFVLTGSGDGTARIWDPNTGKSLVEFRGHTAGITSAEFSPDGRFVLTSSADQTARVWDAGTGHSLFELRGHTAPVSHARFSRDGKLIVTSSVDKTARLWEAATGKNLAELLGHTEWVQDAVFSPDGKFIATASADQTARIWDTASGESLYELQHRQNDEDQNVVFTVEFSPDSRLLLTGSAIEPRIWDVATGKALVNLRGHTSFVRKAIFSHDGKYVLTASGDNTAQLWDPTTGKNLFILRGHTALVENMAFSSDSRYIVTASYDKTSRIWEVKTGKNLAVLRGHGDWVISAVFSPDDKYVLTASNDKTVRIWKADKHRMFELSGHTSYIRAAAFSSSGEYLVTAGYDGTAIIWSLKMEKDIVILQGHAGAIGSASFSPDNQYVVTASTDQTARIWDTTTGKNLFELRGHTGHLGNATFSPDGKRVLTSSDDGTARVWDANTGKQVFEIQHAQGVYRALFSPDGSYILTTGNDYKARVWEASTGKFILEQPCGKVFVDNTSFSPDGKFVVTINPTNNSNGNVTETVADNTAVIWETGTGETVTELRQKSGASIDYAGFSSDGKQILTGSGDFDNIARIWDATSGEVLVELRGHNETVFSGAFSPDNRFIVTASRDNAVRIWEVNTGQNLVEIENHQIPNNFLSSAYLFVFASFSPNGKYIAMANADNIPRIYICEVCVPVSNLLTTINSLVARDLTLEERKKYLHEQ